VQAVARSAQQPAPRPASKWLVLAAAVLGGSIVAGATFTVLSRLRAQDEHGVGLPRAAAPRVSVASLVPSLPSAPVPANEMQTIAPVPSATTSVAANLAKPVTTPGKRPTTGAKPPSPLHVPPPPERRENLFDSRH
jgi:hypothetical protein